MSHLYANIMNLPCYVPKCFFMAGGEALDAYKTGHRDARHAAAYLANEADETIATLRAALQTHGEEAAKLMAERDELLAIVGYYRHQYTGHEPSHSVFNRMVEEYFTKYINN